MAKALRWDDFLSFFNTMKSKLNAKAEKTDLNGAPATIVVAASDSLNKAGADYVCDGTADQEEINAAIKALPSTGGKVLLLEGTYSITSEMMVIKSNVTLEGMGHSTVLHYNISAPSIGGFYSTGEHNHFKNMFLQITSGLNVALYLNGENNTAENVWVSGDNFDAAKIGAYSAHCTIRDCYVDNQIVTSAGADYCKIIDNRTGVILSSAPRCKILYNTCDVNNRNINGITSSGGGAIISNNIILNSPRYKDAIITYNNNDVKNIVIGNLMLDCVGGYADMNLMTPDSSANNVVVAPS